MTNNINMLIDAIHPEETRVVIADGERICEFDHITASKLQIKGNIYLAKITRVEPSLQAAFVEYGGKKQGFLPFSEIHPDYYQIPVADRKKLLEEEAEQFEEDEEYSPEEKESGKKKEKNTGKKNTTRKSRKETAEKDQTSDATNEDTNNKNQEDTSSEDSTSDTTAEEQKKPKRRGRRPKRISAAASSISTSSIEEEEEEENIDEVITQEEGTSKSDADDDVTEDSRDDDDIETVSEDEADESRSRRKATYSRRYKIQEVIKRNQIVLVQVIKEERGNKGVSLTTFISLAGRYCVLMPNSPKDGGISRKISSREDRKRLKEIAQTMKEKHGMSAIIRTNGIDRTKTEIKRDYEYLIKLWTQIREDTLKSNAPTMVYEESDVIKRSIRDLYTAEIEKIWVSGERAYKEAKAFMKMLMPSHAARVKQYKDDTPIFSTYGVEEQLATMFEPEAKLPSGGSIVLHPTEALISIDVNSGRSTTERNVEETAIKTNLEAADEIARQLRLRDLAGLVVIDFIDMYYGKNRRTVERAMKNALKSDRAKIQAGRISSFGLMELSRQRLRSSLAEASNIVCPHCKGTGYIRNNDTIAIQAIRIIEKEAVLQEFKKFHVYTHQDTAIHILNQKRDMITKIEQQYDVAVQILIDNSVLLGGYRLMKVKEDGNEVLYTHDTDKKPRRKRGGKGRSNSKPGRSTLFDENTELEANADNASDNTEGKQMSSTRRGKKATSSDSSTKKPTKRSANRRKKTDSAANESDVQITSTSNDDKETASTKPRTRGTRGSRGRRRVIKQTTTEVESGE